MRTFRLHVMFLFPLYSDPCRIGLCITFFGCLLLLVFPARASAHTQHAEYVNSDPGANALLSKAPSTITIHFSENVDPHGSAIFVYDINHQIVSQPGSTHVDHTDLKTMTIQLLPKTSEVYVVEWDTVSAAEGHHDAGSFRFFVNPSPMLTDMLHANTTSRSMASAKTLSSLDSRFTWITILAEIIPFLIGGLAGAFGIQHIQKKKQEPSTHSR